jgi:hypothetical protein
VLNRRFKCADHFGCSKGNIIDNKRQFKFGPDIECIILFIILIHLGVCVILVGVNVIVVNRLRKPLAIFVTFLLNGLDAQIHHRIAAAYRGVAMRTAFGKAERVREVEKLHNNCKITIERATVRHNTSGAQIAMFAEAEVASFTYAIPIFFQVLFFPRSARATV